MLFYLFITIFNIRNPMKRSKLTGRHIFKHNSFDPMLHGRVLTTATSSVLADDAPLSPLFPASPLALYNKGKMALSISYYTIIKIHIVVTINMYFTTRTITKKQHFV